MHDTEWQYGPGLHAPQPVFAHGWYLSKEENLSAAALQASGVVATWTCVVTSASVRPCAKPGCHSAGTGMNLRGLGTLFARARRQIASSARSYTYHFTGAFAFFVWA